MSIYGAFAKGKNLKFGFLLGRNYKTQEKGVTMSRYKNFIRVIIVLAFMASMLFTSKTAYASQYGTVTASSLNVREKGTTSSKSLGQISKGTQVTIKKKTKDANGLIWYQITTSINKNTVNGYVSSKYVELNDEITYVKRTGQVTASTLNIRKTASTKASIVGKITKGTVVTTEDKVVVNGDTWYKIRVSINGSTVRGYVSAKYIKLHKTTMDSDTYALGLIKNDSVKMYKAANSYSLLRAVLQKNQEVIILGTINVNGTDWYKLKVKMNGTPVYGYVKKSSVTRITSSNETKVSLEGTVTGKVVARKVASKVASGEYVYKNTKVTITATITINNVKWYKCKYTKDGVTKTGYIYESKIQLKGDAEFEESLSKFPSSYHDSLRALHAKYPDWKFVAVDTNLNWSSVIAGENKVGRNTIQSNVPNGGSVSTYSAPFSYLSTAPGAYDWATDKYTLIDGTNWFTASEEVLAYYLDPRNFLTEDLIFQFEALAYDSSQKESVVASLLANTFMSGSYSVKDKITGLTVKGNYVDTFMEAAKISGASPYFLAARSKQELGLNGSGSVSGTYPGYEGYYNYFNIGANDSAGGGAIANGLRYASSGTTYQRPWTNPYKSIVGGAQFIATSYINKGQNTNYFQKFNVVYAPFYSHQYMTNVQAPRSEGLSKYRAYSNLGILDDTYVFYIPVYDNMPSQPCRLPASEGNPNSYLKNITVADSSTNKKLALTPTFDYKTTEYTMVVANDVSSVTIGASTISKHASVTGTGTYSLTAGKTRTINIKCTAGNGTVTTYTVKIARLSQ